MEPKKIYSITWTQSYPQPYTLEQAVLKELYALLDTVIEQCLDEGDFTEANEVIAKVKAL